MAGSLLLRKQRGKSSIIGLLEAFDFLTDILFIINLAGLQAEQQQVAVGGYGGYEHKIGSMPASNWFWQNFARQSNAFWVDYHLAFEYQGPEIINSQNHYDIDYRYLGEVLSQYRSGNSTLSLRVQRSCGTFASMGSPSLGNSVSSLYNEQSSLPFSVQYRCDSVSRCCAVSPSGAPLGKNGVLLSPDTWSSAPEVGGISGTTPLWKQNDLTLTLSDYQSDGTEISNAVAPLTDVPIAKMSNGFVLAPPFPVYVLINGTNNGGDQRVVFTVSRCRAAGNPEAFCKLIFINSPFPIVVWALLAIMLLTNVFRHVPNIMTLWRYHRQPVDDALVKAHVAAAKLDLFLVGAWFAWKLSDDDFLAGEDLLSKNRREELPLLSRLSGTWRPENVWERKPRLAVWTWRPESSWPETWSKCTVRGLVRGLLCLPFTRACADTLYGWFGRAHVCVKLITFPCLLFIAVFHIIYALLGLVSVIVVHVIVVLANFIVYSEKNVALRYVEDIPQISISIVFLYTLGKPDRFAIINLASSALLLGVHVLKDVYSELRRCWRARGPKSTDTNIAIQPSAEELAKCIGHTRRLYCVCVLPLITMSFSGLHVPFSPFSLSVKPYSPPQSSEDAQKQEVVQEVALSVVNE